MVYGLLLTLHAWVRWVVVIATLGTAAHALQGWARGARWTSRDQTIGKVWVAVIDTQVSLGFVLYFVVSPLAAMARGDFGAAWSQISLRFFGILHPLAMMTAVVVVHASWIWVRRGEGRDRFRRLGLGGLGVLALVLLAIPWPFLPYGRPWVRG